jgi:hypothetical protein
MKCLPAKIFFLTTIFCFCSVRASAQNVTYLDENYKPASAANYTYKRVIKYKEPIFIENTGIGIYGNITVNTQPSGLHVCSLIDYYKTGEPALVVSVKTTDFKCSQWWFDGMATFYFKNGNIKQKAPYKMGKLHGSVISYDESGNEVNREDYENGKLIEKSRFAAPADIPITGTWKYVECYNNDCSPKPWDIYRTGSKIVRTSTFIYSPNGVVESRHERPPLATVVIKGNWKYIPNSASSGVLEEYQGEDLIERATVRWLSRNQLEYTITFSQNPDAVGRQTVWTRQ